MSRFLETLTPLALAREPRGIPGLDDVYVHESGKPGSPAVVFIHGGGPDARMWHVHLDRLAGRLHCLAPDLPGFGRSNHLPPLSLRETADLIAQLIEARVSARRAHVVGLSYGGSVVFAMLERHPNRVDRAVIDGAAVLPLWGGWGDRFVELSTTAISPIVNTWPVTALLSLVGLRELGIELSSASPRAFRRAYKEGFTAPTSRAELEAQCPTLLVAGEKEATVRASNAALAELMPHAIARFVPGLGHAWFGWRLDLHVRMLEAWLTGEALPEELEAEPPSPSAVDRVLRRLEEPQGPVPVRGFRDPGTEAIRTCVPDESTSRRAIRKTMRRRQP
jgi:pimeloyl-ACP methyl ester carboxylesterase